MSLLGKILALLNFFGVVALMVLAFMDYSKRQAWAYSVLRHDLAVRGLPLDDKEKGAQGDPERPLVSLLSDATLADMFAQVGGQPQATQIGEVDRVKKLWQTRLTSLPDRQALLALSRMLLPLADTYPEREEMLAGRYYYATDATLKNLETRYRTSFAEALARASEDGKERRVLSFEEAFRVAMRTLGGEPSESFTTYFLAAAPTELPKLKAAGAFEAAWAAALKAQREAMSGRLQERFARAILDGPHVESRAQVATPNLVGLTEQQRLARAAESQKRAIARLLFAQCRAAAEEAADTDPAFEKLDRGSAAYAAKLVESQAYQQALRRVYVVCGLQMALAALADDAGTIRKLAIAAEQGRDQELSIFVIDHGLLVEEVRDRAELLRAELDRLADNTKKRDDQKDLVAKREATVKQLRDELTKARDETQEATAALEQLSDVVLKQRTEVRDAIKKAEKHEKTIRELEALIESRERSRSKK